MTKKTAQIVNQQVLKNMVIATNKNKDLNVTDAPRRLFGKGSLTNDNANDVGSSYGFRRATRYDDFVNSPAIANLNLRVLRIIGSNKNQNKVSIIRSTST